MKNLEFHICRSTNVPENVCRLSVVLPEEWLEKRLCKLKKNKKTKLGDPGQVYFLIYFPVLC